MLFLSRHFTSIQSRFQREPASWRLGPGSIRGLTKPRLLLIRLFVRRGLRYLLVARGFIFVEAPAMLPAPSFLLTGSRIAAIDRWGNRADIIATMLVTTVTITLLRSFNQRVMMAIDRRFFREAYGAQRTLIGLSEAVHNFSDIESLFEQVAGKISEALHPEGIGVFLPDGATGDFVPAFRANHPRTARPESGSGTSLALPRDGITLHWLIEREFRAALDLSRKAQLKDRAGARERNTLRKVRSALLVPIAARGQLLGAISLGPRLADVPYSREDQQLLLAAAAQMAAVLENAKLICRLAEEGRTRREVEMASEVQRRLFPADEFENEALGIFGACLPARGVGGDYYDYFALGADRIGVAIADVAGKGIAAALLMSSVQAALRSQLDRGAQLLTEIVAAINRLLLRSTNDDAYATFIYAQFNGRTRQLTYVNAGHNPPLMVRAAAASELTVGGPVIGLLAELDYQQKTIRVERGDLLIAYTGGVTEAMNAVGEEFGEGRLRALVAASSHLSARSLAEKVIGSLREWQGDAPQHDDITLLVARVR